MLEIRPELARPPRLERGTPGLEGPSSVTFKKWPHFKIPRPPIGYDIAVIFCESFWSRLLPIEAEFRGFWVNLEREVITDRCEIRKFRPDFAYPVDHIVQSRQFAAHHYRRWFSALHKSSIGENRCPRRQPRRPVSRPA